LSPVNIHTLILALRKSAIVSGTSGYNLSSTAVAPIRYRSLSRASAIISFYSSLSAQLANDYIYLSNKLYSYSDNTLIAINNVRNPIVENSDNLASIYGK